MLTTWSRAWQAGAGGVVADVGRRSRRRSTSTNMMYELLLLVVAVVSLVVCGTAIVSLPFQNELLSYGSEVQPDPTHPALR